MSVLVIGATGTTGSRVTAQLRAAGHDVNPASRRTGFDWYEPTTYADVLTGADRAYLVPPVGDLDPAAVMLPFLQQARDAGVRRAVLLSASVTPEGGPVAGIVHAALPGLFAEWAVLRPTWFMQNFTGEHVHARSIRDQGVVLTATGRGRVGFVDADDIAAVAVHALTAERAPNTDFVLTGPETLTYDDIAATVAAVTGRPVVHRAVTPAQLRDHMAAELPLPFATLLADLDRAIAEGCEDYTTDTVHRVTGRAPNTFHAVVTRELTLGAPI
ncbi:ergot alkaloid biosynthesis protein [Allokutzneria sp. NRRL B-24872]|uniref:ergot alkaloid biosynthesis protein n=1 Tax=Allokutzneria sp. NRRL B-24872 TaxID=1137961 RepID=UPI000A39B9CD|nr:ergot alkaloid biosynthesis protein [Allokutzneria sp. NRRL B-24872]